MRLQRDCTRHKLINLMFRSMLPRNTQPCNVSSRLWIIHCNTFHRGTSSCARSGTTVSCGVGSNGCSVSRGCEFCRCRLMYFSCGGGSRNVECLSRSESAFFVSPLFSRLSSVVPTDCRRRLNLHFILNTMDWHGRRRWLHIQL